MSGESQLKLTLLGRFSLVRGGGRIEMSSRKGTAIIAMLAMSRNGERSRGWLQDRLWGSRRHAEAAGSLRRELSNLRKLLNGSDGELLASDRERVRLRLDQIRIDALDDSIDPRFSGEFLEGLDIPGEAGFRDWVREQRAALLRAPRPAPGIALTSALPHSVLDTSRPPIGFGGNQAIAVLPFINVTGDEALDYLAEGISEELIVGLSRVRWLPVIARSSSFSFSDSIDRKLVGQRLGAYYLIEGHVYRTYEAFGVSASLSESATGYAIWSRRFTLRSPALRDELEQFANELTAQLESRIEHAEQIRIRNKRHDPLGVSDLLWRGRWHLNRLTRADAEMAEKLFAEALALDPNSPEALIQTTSALAWSIWAGRQSQAEVLRMRSLAQHACLADPDDGRGFMLAGIAEMWLRHFAEAKTLLQRAIALNPSLALAHAQLGGCHNMAGEPAEAVDHLKASLRLSSNDPNMFYALGELALAYTMLGNWSEAIEHASQSLTRRPAYWYAHVLKINALVRSGDMAAAQAAADELVAVKPNFSKRYLEFLPFSDRSWINHLVDGLERLPGRAPGWLDNAAPDGSE